MGSGEEQLEKVMDDLCLSSPVYSSDVAEETPVRAVSMENLCSHQVPSDFDAEVDKVVFKLARLQGLCGLVPNGLGQLTFPHVPEPGHHALHHWCRSGPCRLGPLYMVNSEIPWAKLKSMDPLGKLVGPGHSG